MTALTAHPVVGRRAEDHDVLHARQRDVGVRRRVCPDVEIDPLGPERDRGALLLSSDEHGVLLAGAEVDPELDLGAEQPFVRVTRGEGAVPGVELDLRITARDVRDVDAVDVVHGRRSAGHEVHRDRAVRVARDRGLVARGSQGDVDKCGMRRRSDTTPRPMLPAAPARARRASRRGTAPRGVRAGGTTLKGSCGPPFTTPGDAGQGGAPPTFGRIPARAASVLCQRAAGCSMVEPGALRQDR